MMSGPPPTPSNKGKELDLELEGLRGPMSILFPGDPNVSQKARAFRQAFKMLTAHRDVEDEEE